uniref:ZP domain-containing protein n=1 Tax=Ciona savignyi TaxID=51511 RepID=H2Z403_CIOSA
MTSFVFPVVMVQTSSFYVNCDITICINPCIPNCKAVRPVINASPSLTKGPVHIHFPATQTSSVTTTTSTMTSQSQRTKGPNYVIPILLILSITACVLLLGALCYNLSRSHGAARRHQIQRRLRKSTFGGSQIDLYKMKTEEAIDTGVD